jgi:hypothetical protein
VGFDVVYGYLGWGASVATWWHLLHIQFAHVTNVILYVFRYLIVKDMFLGDNAGPFELEQKCVVCPYRLSIPAVLHGFNEDGVAVDFHHNHDVFVAMTRWDGELACLVGDHGFAYHVCLGVHITNLLAVEVGGVAWFQRYCPNFGGQYVLSCLVQMPLCSFNCLGIVFLDIAFCQHLSAHVVSRFDGFEPSQFDWVSTDGVQRFDGLLGRW